MRYYITGCKDWGFIIRDKQNPNPYYVVMAFNEYQKAAKYCKRLNN